MIPTNERLPEVGEEVIGFAAAWIQPDFNPRGMRACFRNDDGDWYSAEWNDHQDMYISTEGHGPTHWQAYPGVPLMEGEARGGNCNPENYHG